MLGKYIGDKALSIAGQLDPAYEAKVRAELDKKKKKKVNPAAATDEEKQRIMDMMKPSKRNINVR